MTAQPRLTLYAKPGCHLCEEAQEAIAAMRTDHAFELDLVDITLDPRVNAAYGERIPVLAIDGEEVLELAFSEQEVREALGRVVP